MEATCIYSNCYSCQNRTKKNSPWCNVATLVTVLSTCRLTKANILLLRGKFPDDGISRPHIVMDHVLGLGGDFDVDERLAGPGHLSLDPFRALDTRCLELLLDSLVGTGAAGPTPGIGTRPATAGLNGLLQIG